MFSVFCCFFFFKKNKRKTITFFSFSTKVSEFIRRQRSNLAKTIRSQATRHWGIPIEDARKHREARLATIKKSFRSDNTLLQVATASVGTTPTVAELAFTSYVVGGFSLLFVVVVVVVAIHSDSDMFSFFLFSFYFPLQIKHLCEATSLPEGKAEFERELARHQPKKQEPAKKK